MDGGGGEGEGEDYDVDGEMRLIHGIEKCVKERAGSWLLSIGRGAAVLEDKWHFDLDDGSTTDIMAPERQIQIPQLRPIGLLVDLYLGSK